ncbi:L-type lectin-domain containing receptor kinase IV.4-like [Cucurbita maxima]|uniref:L-type lectin-domain containing receptor kinase IV.4-like n=1 Tax=Cucurbita maxima TaxID=3661 RepID=A0A6J1IM28_CUCMA|nr:L-type lectin-domain containing receptor kinase IV.4-like [Cucurbita maxima]
MAAFHLSNPFPSPTISIFLFFFLLFKSIDSLSSPSFSLSGFRGDPQFELNVALYGDAVVVGDGSALSLSGPVSSSAGRIVYKKPIRLVRGKSRRLMSFSTDFSFSLSPNTGGEGGLGFVILPSSFNVSAFDNGPFGLHFGSEKKQKMNMIVVKFGTSYDSENGDLIRTVVGIDMGYKRNVSIAGSGIVSNSSSALIREKNLHAWIDYEVGSRQLEVRLAENRENKRPSVPLLSFPIDFSQIWGEDEEVVVGLSSSNGNSSSQPCLVYSWSFKLKSIPNWMHSEPLDPKTIAIARESEPQIVVKDGKNCLMRVVAGMIFGTGCGALTAFVALYLWTIFGHRRAVVPEEFAMQQMDVKYEKVVVLDKGIEDYGKTKVDV